MPWLLVSPGHQQPWHMYHICRTNWSSTPQKEELNYLCYRKRQIYFYVSIIDSLWPSDAIWWQRSGSTLAQVMACCLTAPSHYLNQCWLIISEVQWHSYQGKFTRYASTINHQNPLENYISKISLKFPGANELNSVWGLMPPTQYIHQGFSSHCPYGSLMHSYWKKYGVKCGLQPMV